MFSTSVLFTIIFIIFYLVLTIFTIKARKSTRIAYGDGNGGFVDISGNIVDNKGKKLNNKIIAGKPSSSKPSSSKPSSSNPSSSKPINNKSKEKFINVNYDMINPFESFTNFANFNN